MDSRDTAINNRFKSAIKIIAILNQETEDCNELTTTFNYPKCIEESEPIPYIHLFTLISSYRVSPKWLFGGEGSMMEIRRYPEPSAPIINIFNTVSNSQAKEINQSNEFGNTVNKSVNRSKIDRQLPNI